MMQTSVKNSNLPARIDDNDVIKLLNAIKSKPEQEALIKAIYNKGNFDQTKNALETLDLINDQCQLTTNGGNLVKVFSESDEELKKVFEDLFLAILLNYEPYEIFLQSIAHSSKLESTTTEDIIEYWQNHEYGSSITNREEGATTFGKLMYLAGLGTYKVGRHGNKTRIEWKNSAQERIKQPVDLNAHNPSDLETQVIDQEDTCLENNNVDSIDDSHMDHPPKVSESTNDEAVGNNISAVSTKGELLHSEKLVQPTDKFIHSQAFNSTTHIQVNVDMSDWDPTRITAFFKAAYGQFDNESFSPDIQTSIPSPINEISDGSSES